MNIVSGRLSIALLMLALLPLAANGNDRPEIAVVIDDLGFQPRNDRAVLQLDPDVTVAIIPDGPLARELSSLAADQQREVLIHLPLAGGLHDGQCQAALRCAHPDWPPLRMASHLRWAMGRVEHATGINNHEGSRFTANAGATDSLVEGIAILNRLFQQSLFVLDSRTSAHTRFEDKARQAGLAAGRRDVFLDHDRTPEALEAAWQRLLDQARRDGAAIMIGHPHPETIEFLHRVLPELSDQGIVLVPVSTLIGPKPLSPVAAGIDRPALPRPATAVEPLPLD